MELWDKLKAEIEGQGDKDMHFFPSMKNMVVLKYPDRQDASCSDKRLA